MYSNRCCRQDRQSWSLTIIKTLWSAHQMSKWKLMKWRWLGPLVSSPCYVLFVFHLLWLHTFFSTLCLINVCNFHSLTQALTLFLSTSPVRQLNGGQNTRQKDEFTIEQKAEVWHASTSHNSLSLILNSRTIFKQRTQKKVFFMYGQLEITG